MKYSVVIGALAIAVPTLAFGAWAVSASPEKQITEPADYFTERDFAAFDHSADEADERCRLSLRNSKTCIYPSPVETRLHIGELLPSDVPQQKPSLSVLMALPQKAAGLSTYQYGQTLVLVDDETGQIRDTLSLGRENFGEAHGAGLYAEAGLENSGVKDVLQ